MKSSCRSIFKLRKINKIPETIRRAFEAFVNSRSGIVDAFILLIAVNQSHKSSLYQVTVPSAADANKGPDFRTDSGADAQFSRRSER